ncbi:hypothetical protein SDC9_125383 [bioreactor metagenome]|uniref:Uncharacterized protein n=1 Tax=bioreactor metagenome TaxID=1076179 RepID=A0A645CNM3_9ZZZZ
MVTSNIVGNIDNCNISVDKRVNSNINTANDIFIASIKSNKNVGNGIIIIKTIPMIPNPTITSNRFLKSNFSIYCNLFINYLYLFLIL